MKKVLFLMMAFAMSLTVAADTNLPIQVTDLPQPAQTFITTYFGSDKVSSAMLKRDSGKLSYQVKFGSGCEIDFNRKGMWTQVDCGKNAVPEGIVPSPITAFVSGWNPNAIITEIEKDRGHIEITLNTGVEMKFNKKYNVIDIDD